MSVNLTVLKYGETVFGENHIFLGGDCEKLLPISFCIYLLETENRKILVDAGCDDGAGFPMSIFCTPTEALAHAGLTPDDITVVIITHAHRDHVESVRHFEKARIYIQKEEYESGKKFIPEGFDVILFDEKYTIDNEIFVKNIGGHSKGSCVVEFELGEKTAVLCGDECYTDRNIKEKIPTGASKRREISNAFIEEYSKEKYRVFTCHDPNIMRGKIGAMRIF